MCFNGVKVFSATMANERNDLGDMVTVWLAEHPDYELTEIIVTQSSDQAFHCLTLTVFYNNPAAASRLLPKRPKEGLGVDDVNKNKYKRQYGQEASHQGTREEARRSSEDPTR